MKSNENDRCSRKVPPTSCPASDSLSSCLQTSFVGRQPSDRKCPLTTASRNAALRDFAADSVGRGGFRRELRQKGRRKLLNRIITRLSIFSRDTLKTLRRFNQSHIWRFHPATSCRCRRRMGQEQEVGPSCSIWLWIGRSTLLIRGNLASRLSVVSASQKNPKGTARRGRIPGCSSAARWQVTRKQTNKQLPRLAPRRRRRRRREQRRVL